MLQHWHDHIELINFNKKKHETYRARIKLDFDLVPPIFPLPILRSFLTTKTILYSPLGAEIIDFDDLTVFDKSSTSSSSDVEFILL
jgi:hypothetical protein